MCIDVAAMPVLFSSQKASADPTRHESMARAFGRVLPPPRKGLWKARIRGLGATAIFLSRIDSSLAEE